MIVKTKVPVNRHIDISDYINKPLLNEMGNYFDRKNLHIKENEDSYAIGRIVDAKTIEDEVELTIELNNIKIKYQMLAGEPFSFSIG